MSTKAPPPCPPPRPDLETDSSVSKASSRTAPPPIPLRPDLGEGVDENVVNIPKIPPPTLPKKPSVKKKPGRPEISIISAQPMSSSGAFVPFVPKPPAIPVPSQTVPQSTLKETEPEPLEPPSVDDPVLETELYLEPTPGQSSAVYEHTQAPSAFSFSTATEPSMPDPGPFVTPEKPASTSFITSSAPSTSNTIPSSSFSTTIPSPAPTSIPTSTMATLQPTKPAPQIPANVFKESSPPKVMKSNKPREPPQRPKSKPVCEPSLATDPFQVSFQSTEVVEKPQEPIAPKRTKNKPKKQLQESEVKGLGINNSAFQELEASQVDSMFMADVGMKKETPPSKKVKSFPTVIRTKPNGKENPKNDTSPSYQDDLVQLDSTQVRYTKPTAIKTPSRNKPPPPPSQKTGQDSATGNPSQISSTPILDSKPQQGKAKARPTIIIPKVKKDENKQNESETITSPPELTKTEVESKSNLVEEKSSKPKRKPNIIRPNRQKKDKNTVDSRGMPEGQSHEGSQAKPKIVPIRKAPPRPSPPKPGPPRPGPPKKQINEASAPQIRSQPAGNVATEVSYPENSNKGKSPPRPATIGKEKGAENKQKNNESTIVSSVVETKIEPSCIALYDYDSANPDDLSFKAGDEIFLIQRINADWYMGRVGDCEGMMPVKFVEIIEDLPVETEKSMAKVSVQSSLLNALVLYDFPGQSPDELTLHAGDTVLLLELINDDWLKGSCNGQTGIFPSNFVDFTQEMKQTLSQQKKNIKTGPKSMTVVSSGPRCKALYDYCTDNDDDLNFNKNDIIQLTERINVEWLKGEVHGVTGMFPAAYVDIIEDLVVVPSSTSSSSRGSSTSSQPVARALHDYISDTDGDLSFREGDVITIVNIISDEWLEGELNGEKGIFPASFVENIGKEMSKPQDQLLPKAKALYDFIGESEQELSFKTGDEILLLQQINSDWMEGELHGHIGQFPSAFVEVLVPLP